jgi:hypothetical protein
MTTDHAPREPRPRHRPRASTARPRHLYYFNGAGPVARGDDRHRRPGQARAHRWKVEQVALAALENAERLVDDRDSGRGEAA